MSLEFKPKLEGTRIEEKEKEGEVDFVEIFKQKLESIEPIPENQREYEAWQFEEVGIEKVKRKADAILFKLKHLETLNFDLWIEDPKDIGPQLWIHERVEQRFEEKFLTPKGLGLETNLPLPGFIIQDNAEELYLLVADAISKYIKSEVEIKTYLKDWVDFCKNII